MTFTDLTEQQRAALYYLQYAVSPAPGGGRSAAVSVVVRESLAVWLELASHKLVAFTYAKSGLPAGDDPARLDWLARGEQLHVEHTPAGEELIEGINICDVCETLAPGHTVEYADDEDGVVCVDCLNTFEQEQPAAELGGLARIK